MLRATWLERDEVKAELDNCIPRVCCSDVGAAREAPFPRGPRLLSEHSPPLPSLPLSLLSMPLPLLFSVASSASVPPRSLAPALLILFVFSGPPGISALCSPSLAGSAMFHRGVTVASCSSF